MFARRRPPPKDMNLNITSLMDILTIVLIFLIQSFSTQEHEIPPPKDFSLPNSTAEVPVKLAVKVSVGEGELTVEDKVVASLADGKFRRADVNRARLVTPLLQELQRQKARLQSGEFRALGDKSEDDAEIVYFEAARGTTFETIDQVLKTAAAAGFSKFRLAVNRKV